VSKKVKIILAVSAGVIVAAGFFVVMAKGRQKPVAVSSEIEQIKATQDLKAQSEIYRRLLERVGPLQAQEELFRSGLPFTGQTHLLNHVAGDYIFEKYGKEGLSYCRPYFLESCYHGFLLHIIGAGGEAKIEDLQVAMDSCAKAGPSVPSQCSHGFGHGFVAAIGYKNLPQALKRCDEVGAQLKDFPLYNCHDGAFMENIWAVHEGTPSPDRWVRDGDNLYPCNAPEISPHQVRACWSNQPSLLFQRFGKIKQVADVCASLSDGSHRETCYDGLARQIHPMTNGNADTTFKLCSEMEAMSDFCVMTIVLAGFSVGDRNTPFELCARIKDSAKEDCHNRLIGIMKAYVPDAKERVALCEKLKEPWKQRCKAAG
jgi:hypothetical protein